MLNKLNKYKKQITDLLHHNTYSKRTPLNTKTTTKILKPFTFEPYKTYIEINSLEKKDKEVILKAQKTKVLDKILEVSVPNEIYEQLLELI